MASAAPKPRLGSARPQSWGTAPMGFPSDFWWGTGASSTQSEGAAPASDWFREEQRGTYPRSGDGNGFGTRYAEDFALYAEHGLRHHRLSIEWARIEPEEGRRDPAAIEHYRMKSGTVTTRSPDERMRASWSMTSISMSTSIG